MKSHHTATKSYSSTGPSSLDFGTHPETASKVQRHKLDRKSIRILIADDHCLMRQVIRCLLSVHSDIEIVGEAINGIEAVELAAKLNPDLILMDINMPFMDGITATRIIHRSTPDIVILGLSMHLMEDIGCEIIAAGAVALVCKSDPVDHLLKVIRLNLSCV